ncbi:MAG: hypothetical protein FWC15_05355 [Fibromonadales bacterium]|nr:hypothetical protein [Fibromonadales bacterium]
MLLLLGVAGIVVYSFYPDIKSAECFAAKPHSYGEAQVGDNSFKCILPEENTNCGMTFSFDNNRNWNMMDSLILHLQSSENFKELIVQILTYDPDNRTNKPALKELNLNSSIKRYSIPMEYFYTPDYWFEQQNAKNTHNARRFSSVVGLEMYSGWKNPIDEPLELKLESICAEGLSNSAFVFLVIYIAILITIAISVRIRY